MEINNIDITKPLSDDNVVILKTYISRLKDEDKLNLILELFDEVYMYNVVTEENQIVEKNISSIFTAEDMIHAQEYLDEEPKSESQISKEEKVKEILSVYSDGELSDIKEILSDCAVVCVSNVPSFSTLESQISNRNGQFYLDKIEEFEKIIVNLKKLNELNKL